MSVSKFVNGICGLYLYKKTTGFFKALFKVVKVRDILTFFNRLERKNSLISQALESSKENLNALLTRLEITRKDIDQVLTPLSSLQAQHPGHFKSVTSDDEAFKTFKSSKGKTFVFKERNDYGDMEELD